MLSCLFVSVCIALWSSRARAQSFVALVNDPGYDSLAPCQQTCLTKPGYADLDAAKSNCDALNTTIVDLDRCVSGYRDPEGSAACLGNSTAVVGAQSVLAAYCTSAIANVYGTQVSVPYVTVGSVPITATPDTAVSSDPSTKTDDAVSSTTGTTDDALTSTTGTIDAGPSLAATASSLDAPAGASVTGNGGPGVPSSTSTTTALATPPAGSANSTSGPDEIARKQGLTSGAKAGIGVGVALGILAVAAAIAAWWFLNRRKKTRAAGGPYGPVMTSEKGRTESGSYSSPRMEPQEMHPIAPTAPFLPAMAAHNAAHHENSYEPTPVAAMPKDVPYSDSPTSTRGYEGAHSSPQHERHPSAQARPATSRDVSRGGTPPPPLDTQARPATAHAVLAPPDDEPPSPISPVSPISPAGSRPASLREHHDL